MTSDISNNCDDTKCSDSSDISRSTDYWYVAWHEILLIRVFGIHFILDMDLEGPGFQETYQPILGLLGIQ